MLRPIGGTPALLLEQLHLLEHLLRENPAALIVREHVHSLRLPVQLLKGGNHCTHDHVHEEQRADKGEADEVHRGG